MNNSLPAYLELIGLFILLPVSFLWSYPIYIKMVLVIIGLLYIIIRLKRAGAIHFDKTVLNQNAPFWKRLGIQLLLLIIITTVYVYIEAPDKLFSVPLKKPGLWLVILAVYTFLSVWPQEVIYRTYFFKRFEVIFKNKWVLILVNGLLFSLAHIFFKNVLVLVLTFIGGILFAYTYFTTRSTLLVSIEHAIYGNWLFTVGMGEMLAFPGAE
ncbi:CPBP family intramembrane metalloprotease [Aquimarina sp. ERC-38]|uniref:CPBP family intramembrane glutamic endopeptidase n=1 Tax=Aquimarina sp. ERC-38 TaxID=2949996 RepID=UPI0022478B7C|nr:CPBP family intramembrane glutamic endopeptidase [Aquimarina sp. ERC-38]UZO79725.1 CPBP family intramembrane metalloprotease [Aquimarina sp. ERC-38]